MRLLNEESCQRATQLVTTPGIALAVTPATQKTHRPLEQITCFHCGEKGHYQINCPKQKAEEKALPLSSSKKRKKLGEVVYFVFSLPSLFLSYLVLSCFICGRVSEYWLLRGKLTRLIVVIIFDILMFYLQINSSYSYPVILSCLDLVRPHSPIVVT